MNDALISRDSAAETAHFSKEDNLTSSQNQSALIAMLTDAFNSRHGHNCYTQIKVTVWEVIIYLI